MKTVLYMAMTANGYIAKANDDTPWSATEWRSYYSTVKKFKAIIIGSRTYDIMLRQGEFKKIKNRIIVVAEEKKQSYKNFLFVSSPREALRVARKLGCKSVLLGGGGATNGAFMKQGLVDEIILDIEPLVFGSGIKLFGDSDFEKQLQLFSAKKLSKNTMQLKYKVKK